FDGIVIYLLFNDTQHHNKPHVHVFYGEFRASVAIDGTILAGELPAKQLKSVQEWLKKNEENGIVYSDNPKPMLSVLEIKHMYSGVYLMKFSNNQIRLFDSTILKGEVFEPLKRPEIYENPKLEYGIVTWDDGQIDCSPEYMFENSFEYNTCEIIVA
ncbi:MAG: DUF4160 domain-containing protein, partial [Treponemataceae bacterium]|nr:DUF4160 domain-containing protein [Treponemataceae bacterium]